MNHNILLQSCDLFLRFFLLKVAESNIFIKEKTLTKILLYGNKSAYSSLTRCTSLSLLVAIFSERLYLLKSCWIGYEYVYALYNDVENINISFNGGL